MEITQPKEKRIISGYPLILNYLGVFAILIGLLILVPLLTLIFYVDSREQALYFIIPSFSSIAVGLLVLYIFRGREKGRLERNQDAILVTLIWMLSIFVGALPFWLSGDYHFTHSIFETTSGFSTTGLTVVDVENTSHLFLFYRSFLQFVGGVGLVLVLTSAISDKFGMRLYNAEGHADKLLPNLIRSTRMIMSIYVGYILVGAIILFFLGMNAFDAINHSIAAVATGGFSTRVASIGHYDNVWIEIVIMVLMVLGGTSFLVHLRLLKGKFKDVFSHIEIKLLGILSLIFVPIFIINLLQVYDGVLGSSLRVASFQFLSAITGTGYQTIPSFTVMPPTFIFGLIILMVLGASMGSTAGGIKQYRVALAFKSIYWNFKQQMSHRKTVRARFINKVGAKTLVESEDIKQNFAFVLVYLIVLVVGTLIFTGYGHSLSDALFEFASALGTVGLSVGIVNYDAPRLLLWTGTVGMFLGRLEFYVVVIAIFKFIDDISKPKQPNLFS